MTDYTNNPLGGDQGQNSNPQSQGAGAKQSLAASQGATRPMGAAQGADPVVRTSYQATYGGPETSSPGQGAMDAAASAGSVFYSAPQGSPAGSGVSREGVKQSSGAKTFLIAFAGALVACVLALGVGNAVGLIGAGSSVTLGSTASTPITSSDNDASLAEEVAAKCLPSVVSIDVYTEQSSGSWYSPSNSTELTETSLGSGVVLTSDGYIITNNHVVENGDAYKVTIEGVEYDAELVGADSSSDIAVIKAKNATGLTPVELGDSDNLTIGEWVMSIGSPYGYEQSVATGIVSATSRSQIMNSSSGYGSAGETTVYTNMIQTDAAINPGNSGGALVDAEGKLIGINTLITSSSNSYSGVGFAIPVNYAVSLAQDIIDGKTPSHAQLGVTLTTVNSSVAQRYGFAVKEGAYVSSVSQGSGAESAGIEVGDILTAVDGSAVASADDVILAVRSKMPGDTVTISINRDGQTMDVQVTLGSDADTMTSTQQSSADTGSTDSGSLLDLFDRMYGEQGSGSGDAA